MMSQIYRNQSMRLNFPSESFVGQVKYVISRYDKNLSWLEDLPPSDVVIYNYGKTQLQLPRVKNVISFTNDNSVDTYLSYIITNYNNLPDVIVFSHGNEGSDYLMHLARYASQSNTGLSKFTQKPFKTQSVNMDKFTKWFETIFDQKVPTINFYSIPSLTFAITKKNILSRSKAFYQKILVNPNTEQHYINLMWYYVPVQNFNKVKIYAICLRSNMVRFERVNAIKSKLPILHIVDAVDSSLFTNDYIKGLEDANFLINNKPYLYEDVACFMSHRKTLEQIAEQEEPYAIVMEDNISICPKFHESIYKVIEAVNTNYKYEDCNFIDLYTQSSKDVQFPSSCCYLVRKSSVDEILGAMKAYDGPISYQMAKFEIGYINGVGIKKQHGTP